MINGGRTPDDESFERMKEQVLASAGINEPDQELLDQIAAIEAIQADPTSKE